VVIEGLKKLSLGELFARLHDSIIAVARNIGKLTERNREISLVDIVELRNHIKERLKRNEELAENEKLLNLIELFKEDKNAIELIKIDLDEWMDFLEAIKYNIEQSGQTLNKKETQELQQIKREITALQGVLRKQA
jgi:hypothetical protein